ncbi:hypothetical protein [Micromonospora sp. NPDC023737]|uniref:hypothetical protein n=1 Tax=unclassified Micromonospora TaxID=2617518 RepID=UPI0033DE9E7D
MYGAPLVAGAGTTVAIGESGLSPSNLRVYDVSTTPATLRGIINGSDNGLWDLNDLTITPDGSQAITVFPGSGVDVWDTTTLTKVRTYGSRSEYPGAPRSVARSADGAYLAAAFDGDAYGPYAAVYDSTSATRTYQTTITNNATLVAGSLSVMDHNLFALQKDRQRNRYYLWRVAGATLPASTLTLSPAGTATAIEPFSLTGRLTLLMAPPPASSRSRSAAPCPTAPRRSSAPSAPPRTAPSPPRTSRRSVAGATPRSGTAARPPAGRRPPPRSTWRRMPPH